MKDNLSGAVVVRQMAREDVGAVVNLQRRVYPEDLAWSTQELLGHIQVFPEGQLVALEGSGRVMGSASSLIIDWDDYAETARWSAITGQGTFSTHNPLGKTLYGADMCVDPTARRSRVGTLLYDARKQMVRKRGLKRLLTGGRIPGYAQVSAQLSPQELHGWQFAGRAFHGHTLWAGRDPDALRLLLRA
jgi:ribosomal protein S18 acetylase RimI-like enzyme